VLDSCGLLRFGYIAKREHFRNTSLILPKTRKSIRRLQIAMVEIVGEGSRVVAIVGKFVFSRMAQHVWMHREDYASDVGPA
jgi:hypothetical protein